MVVFYASLICNSVIVKQNTLYHEFLAELNYLYINKGARRIALSIKLQNKCGTADKLKSRNKRTHQGWIESEHGEGKERVQYAHKDPHV